MEAGLMKRNLERRSERLRAADYYQMGEDQSKWDEYDEIWGFDMVPENRPTHVRDLEGLRNRQSGAPDQLNIRDRGFLCEDGKKESDQRAESRNAMTDTIYEYTFICRLTGSRHTGGKGPDTARADGGRG
eukprot:11782120-Heterocapsa_arctica.AAC.1